MSLSIEDCRSLVAQGMERVDELIRLRLSSDVVLINQLSAYIIGSGGKRVRPQLVLLAAAACGLDCEESEGGEESSHCGCHYRVYPYRDTAS